MTNGRPGYMSSDYRRPGDKAHQKSSRAAVVRRRKLALLAATAVVVVVAVVTAFYWPGFAVGDAEPETTQTVTAPPPTPTADPVERPDDATDFLSALPDSVLAMVLLDVTGHEWTEDAEAVEAWSLTYGDGSPDGDEVLLAAGQWADEAGASDVHDALLRAAGEPLDEGPVTVDGEEVGTYTVTPGTTAGGSVLTWRNGTAVFQATGPEQLVQDFYTAFPL